MQQEKCDDCQLLSIVAIADGFFSSVQYFVLNQSLFVVLNTPQKILSRALPCQYNTQELFSMVFLCFPLAAWLTNKKLQMRNNK